MIKEAIGGFCMALADSVPGVSGGTVAFIMGFYDQFIGSVHGMLYDFYGELLTEHQRKIYEDVVLNDMSLSEIAEEQGISRQGVHDLVRRCDRTLQSYEERLHLIARFQKVKHTVEKIEQISTETQVRELAGQILEEL